MPWTLFDTAIGACGLAWNDTGVTWFQLPEETRDLTAERLLARARTPGEKTTPRRAPAWVARAIELARVHLAGAPQSFAPIPLDLTGIAPFTTKVYRALQEVPAGSTVSYGDLARAVGSPAASRAVGRAMATNPVPVFIPCHRVLASAGKPGGFSAYGGVVTKERILTIEGWKADAPTLFTAGESAPPYDRAEALRHLTTSDRVLGAHLARVGAFTLSLKETEGVFAALAESIVYQQLNGKAAATIFGRVRALLPKSKMDPRAIAAVTDDALRGAGLSRGKLAALRDLSERTIAGRIPTLGQLGRMDDDTIVEKLTEVRGIGRWTVEMLLIFRLGRPDVLPVADYGIRKGYARLFHRGKAKTELPSEADLAKRGERWRPFRSVASWYLWRAADAG